MQSFFDKLSDQVRRKWGRVKSNNYGQLFKCKLSLVLLCCAVINSGCNSLNSILKTSEKATIAENLGILDPKNNLANAFPGSLAISVFPKSDAASLRLAKNEQPVVELADEGFNPNGKSLKAKIADQNALLAGTAASCLPAALAENANVVVETCYDFDQDMLYGTKDIAETPIKWLGTKNGKNSAGEACLVAFTRAQAATVNTLLDQTLGLGMAALCQYKKDHPKAILPAFNAPFDLRDSLSSILGSGGSVSHASLERLADKDAFPVYAISMEVALTDGFKRTIAVTHSPRSGTNSEFTGTINSLIEGIPALFGSDNGVGEQKYQVFSITYARTIDASASLPIPTLSAELRSAQVAASVAASAITSAGVLDFNAGSNVASATFEDEGYGAYTNYSKASEAMENITLFSFSLNPDTNEGRLAYWKNSGGDYYENARGFTIALGATSAAGDETGCVGSGSASTDLNKGISIRRFLNKKEAANNLALAPVAFWHPLMSTPDAMSDDSDGTFKIKVLPSGKVAKWYIPQGSNSTFNNYYSSAESGPLTAQQCFALSATASSYAVDSSKTPDPSGFSASDASGDSNLAKFTVPALPKLGGPFTIKGSISGLGASGLVLGISTGDTLQIDSGASSFTFTTSVISVSKDLLSIITQPRGYTCALDSSAAVIAVGNVDGFAVTCNPKSYTISGTISGLEVSGLVLQNNLTDSLTVASGASSFAFAAAVQSGSPYSVSVATQPTGYICSIASGVGTVAASAIANVVVVCASTARTIGGTISGAVAAGLQLKNNAGDALTVSANATQFVFSTAVALGSTYAVTVFSQPVGYACSVTNGSGTVGAANISNVAISCVPGLTIGGSISGLVSSGLVLRNNGGDNLSLASGASTFTFATALAPNASYAVTVLTQPSNYICTPASASGTTSSTSITNIVVSCVSTASINCNVTGTGIASSTTVPYNTVTKGCNASGYHGTGTLSATCTSNGQNLTATGCVDDNAITCNINNVTGLSSATTHYNTSNASVSCNAAGYSGSVTVPACTTNGATLTVSSGSCTAITCPVTGTGIASNSTVAYNATSMSCNASGYTGTGTLSATCTNGSALTASGCTLVVGTATGGTITTPSGYKVHSFTSNGTFTVSDGSLTVDYLVVGGGGAGGSDRGGGGGAGRFLSASAVTLSAGSYTITVGAGGTGVAVTAAGGNGVKGNSGSSSSIAGSGFTTVTAAGGGGGGGCAAGGIRDGISGASGGGGSQYAGDGAGGTATAGNAGGAGSEAGAVGGGGGGAGAVGGAASSSAGGNGGSGSASSITGSSVIYAAGGGGGGDNYYYTNPGGTGGNSCAGDGPANSNTNGGDAAANKGCGGGGSAVFNSATNVRGGNGGSGVVILRYTYP